MKLYNTCNILYNTCKLTVNEGHEIMFNLLTNLKKVPNDHIQSGIATQEKILHFSSEIRVRSIIFKISCLEAE